MVHILLDPLGDCMKVALCTEILYPLYGVEKRVYEMAKRLPHYGVEVDLFTSTPQRSLPDVNIIQVSKPTITNPPKRNYTFCLNYWAGIFRRVGASRYDLIDANGHLSLLPCSAAGVLSRKPVVATIHDLYLSEWSAMYSGKASPFGLAMEVLSAKLPFEKILTMNTSLKRKLIEQLRVPHEKVGIIPSGIDLRYLQRVKAGKKRERVIYVGRLAPQKNVSLLLRALHHVPSLTLDVIGEGEERTSLEELAAQLGVADRVVFHGKIDDHEKIMKMVKESLIFALPSKRESFGITVLEAMACGTAVVSTNTEGPRDRIISGSNGFLSAFNERDFGKKMQAVASNRALRKRLEKNGLETAAEYDWENIVARIAAVYEEVLREPRRQNATSSMR